MAVRRDLQVTESLAIPMSEIEWVATPSGGPGGQHANRTSSRVEVRYDVERSGVLDPRQRAALLKRFGPVVVAVSSDERSQARNRAIALERLASRIEVALRPRTPRRPTGPTRASKTRRLEEKSRRALTKRGRMTPREEDP